LVLAALLLVVAYLRRTPTDRSDAPPTQDVGRQKFEPAVEPGPRAGREIATPNGGLREIGGGALESAAGLRYRRGSAEGHRIDHVLRHAVDAPERPVHGVYDGNRAEILALIDEAYTVAQQRGPPDVRAEREGQRTIYTVNLRRRIGYLGGREGARRGRPGLTHLRLVLEGHDVITAFPVRP
jgi:hypothetical protein